jgi:chemotaxis protein histidine kinase CheA
MDQMDDEIMTMFVEDTREHLGDIESALMDMERDGADIDEELVIKVFRAAHSIKGGAGFLNLNNIRDLAHKLESLLHMIRSREIVPDTRVINRLLAGFDRLLGLVDLASASDQEDIGAMLAELSGLTAEHLRRPSGSPRLRPPSPSPCRVAKSFLPRMNSACARHFPAARISSLVGIRSDPRCPGPGEDPPRHHRHHGIERPHRRLPHGPGRGG